MRLKMLGLYPYKGMNCVFSSCGMVYAGVGIHASDVFPIYKPA